MIVSRDNYYHHGFNPGQYITIQEVITMRSFHDSTLLCPRCIDAIKSRGEPVFVGPLIFTDYDDNSTHICEWCEETGWIDKLHECVF